MSRRPGGARPCHARALSPWSTFGSRPAADRQGRLLSSNPDLRAARTLVGRSPLRETAYALLMDALAAQGNVAEAMRVYDRARTALDHELGITPGRVIQEAHARLLGVPARPH